MGTGVPSPEKTESGHLSLSLPLNAQQTLDKMHGPTIRDGSAINLAVSLLWLCLQYFLPWAQAHRKLGSQHRAAQTIPGETVKFWLKESRLLKPKETVIFNFLPTCTQILRHFSHSIISWPQQQLLQKGQQSPEVLASLVARQIKNLPAMQETQVQFLGWENPLEEEIAIHSSILLGNPMDRGTWGYSPWGCKTQLSN